MYVSKVEKHDHATPVVTKLLSNGIRVFSQCLDNLLASCYKVDDGNRD